MKICGSELTGKKKQIIHEHISICAQMCSKIFICLALCNFFIKIDIDLKTFTHRLPAGVLLSYDWSQQTRCWSQVYKIFSSADMYLNILYKFPVFWHQSHWQTYDLHLFLFVRSSHICGITTILTVAQQSSFFFIFIQYIQKRVWTSFRSTLSW